MHVGPEVRLLNLDSKQRVGPVGVGVGGHPDIIHVPSLMHQPPLPPPACYSPPQLATSPPTHSARVLNCVLLQPVCVWGEERGGVAGCPATSHLRGWGRMGAGYLTTAPPPHLSLFVFSLLQSLLNQIVSRPDIRQRTKLAKQEQINIKKK